MLTVHEVSKLTGVTVRALHHYDAIGLLRPAKVTEAGYRLYNGASLERLQAILLFRELEFSLTEIKSILDSPGYDRREALRDQLELLRLRRDRLNGLIVLTEKMLDNGGYNMDFNVFDDSKEREYAAEAKKRWGDTAAWRECEAKQPGKDAAEGLMAVFAGFGRLKELPAESAEAQEAVAGLKQYISDNFYECTDEILSGLGRMYLADPRFRESIDASGGEGTAEFVSKAVGIFCKGQ